jgi:hypothetical protein
MVGQHRVSPLAVPAVTAWCWSTRQRVQGHVTHQLGLLATAKGWAHITMVAKFVGGQAMR